MRTIVGAAVLTGTAMLLGGCSVESTIGAPWCEGSRTSALIVAQSVPTATEVWCLEEIPSGWDVEKVSVVEDGTTLTLDSDRAGDAAATLHFAAECDVGEAVATPSDHPRTERFEEITSVSPAFIAKRIYRFDGGCFWWDFRFDPGAPAGLSVELGNALTVISRTELNDNIRETFIDEDI